MHDGPYRNKILRNCSPEMLARLELQPIELPVLTEIERPGRRIRQLTFLETGLASMTSQFKDGTQVEIGLAGFEAVLGASVMVGTKLSLNPVYMQVSGSGYVAPVALALAEFRRFETFHDLLVRHLQAQFIQSAQTAACNARHRLDQRLARWLLLCTDRMGKDTLNLSQEFLADMLGITRPSVSIAAGQMQTSGLIQYTRGKIDILDRKGLERVSCECYWVVRAHLANWTEYDAGWEGYDVGPG